MLTIVFSCDNLKNVLEECNLRLREYCGRFLEQISIERQYSNDNNCGKCDSNIGGRCYR